MLDVINRYLHGFVAVPVILACRKKGLFELLEHQVSLTREQIVESLGANGGQLQVALRMMRSLNWLSLDEVGQYSLTDKAQLHKKLPEEILDLYHLPIESYLMGEQPSGQLINWISRSIQRWNVDDPMMADFLDGILVIPILLALHKHNLLVEDEQKPLFSQLSAPVRDQLYELFISKGWALRPEGNYYLTNVGRFIAERALITGTTASYTPMLSRMSDVLFGDCQAVFRRDALGQESHVDRTLNVVASGFQHEKYFADVEDIILSIFNQLPIEEQPKYVVDMGCGDGTLLKRVYETICSKSARGKVLDQYPLCMIGVDYNEASITATARTLVDIPHLVFQGDIADPEQMMSSMKAHGIHDPENILHIRSFLDHDRPFIPPQNLDKVQTRSGLPYQGVYVAPTGDFIPPHTMVQSLVEHLERWSKVVTKPGLIILEVHCLEPNVVNRFLDKSENLHFDAYQAFSMQHLVEADVFLMAAAEVGLFPKFEFSKRYPKTFPFTRITLNCFEKRPYRIRHPHLLDLPALVNLEAKCWPLHLRASSDEIRQRLECFPNGHCVLEMDSIIVGVVYSQRISRADALKNTTYAEVPSLHTRQGSIIQLLGINILPELQDKGLGDQLREFILQLCTLKGGIERVVGVTRCKNYVSHAHIPIEEYIHQRSELGQILDPILRFHSSSGATIKGIIPNYRPEDIDNLGNGVLIEYDIHNRLQFHCDKALKMESVPKQKIGLQENETLDNLIEECIRFVLGSRRRAAFARSRSLMEMGLDSLELLELRALMSQRLGVELEPTFFFQYGTCNAIARYFKGTEGSDIPTALPNLDEPENVGRTHFEYRLAVVAESNLQLRDELTAFAEGKETFKLVSSRVNSTLPPKIAFLFTGQGSQYIGMGRQLYELSPTFRQTLDRCDFIVRPYLDSPLLNVLYPEPGKTSPINETAYTQPALFALEYALAQLWQSWGIKPAAVMGHSVGEYVAATVAGVFSLEDGLKLMAARGRLMQALPCEGEMVAVLASEHQVAPVIQPYLQEVAIAAVNGPLSVVISGKRSTIRLVVEQLEATGIKTTPLQVSHAFHSPLIEPMLEEFARVASEVTYSPPKIDLISNVTGELAKAQVATPEYWCRHVRCPVRFAAGMEALSGAGYEVFVECGPKPIMLGMGRSCLREGVGRWLPSLHPGQEDWQQILQSLAQLYVEGVQVDWSGFDQDYERRKVALLTYPFQRQHYWIETPQKPSRQNKPSKMQQAVNPLLGQTTNLGIKGVQINGENLSALSDKPQVSISKELVDQLALANSTTAESVSSNSPSSLPRLPLPSLEETCKLYLEIVAPLLNETELDLTRGVVRNFQQTIGLELQKQLEEIAHTTSTSYVYEFWKNRYLDNRLPLPIYQNIGSVTKTIFKNCSSRFAHCTAITIVACLQFYNKIVCGELEPDEQGRFCMSQYKNLFGTTRIPKSQRDTLLQVTEQQHIAIVFRNVFYWLNPFQDEEIQSVADIEQQIDWILNNTSHGQPALGTLTTLSRNEWAILRERLINSAPENAESLALLESALFVLCLDESTPVDLEAALMNALHGGGRNRWFDKSLQCILTPDGLLSGNFEHTGVDGYPIMRFMNEVIRNCQLLEEQLSISNTVKFVLPQPLRWSLTEDILSAIAAAEAEVDHLIGQYETRVLDFNPFGKEFLISHKLNPDAVVQLAFQLTYTRMHGEMAFAYQPVQTRFFHYGRTEAMRPLTPEAVELIKVFTNTSPKNLRWEALQRAVNAHVSRQFACLSGYGADRHLFALYNLSLNQGLIPEFFQDKAYKEIFSKSVLITSGSMYTSPNSDVELAIFGPEASHEYGIVYRIQPEKIIFNVTCKHRQTGTFIEMLKQCLLEFETLIPPEVLSHQA